MTNRARARARAARIALAEIGFPKMKHPTLLDVFFLFEASGGDDRVNTGIGNPPPPRDPRVKRRVGARRGRGGSATRSPLADPFLRELPGGRGAGADRDLYLHAGGALPGRQRRVGPDAGLRVRRGGSRDRHPQGSLLRPGRPETRPLAVRAGHRNRAGRDRLEEEGRLARRDPVRLARRAGRRGPDPRLRGVRARRHGAQARRGGASAERGAFSRAGREQLRGHRAVRPRRPLALREPLGRASLGVLRRGDAAVPAVRREGPPRRRRGPAGEVPWSRREARWNRDDGIPRPPQGRLLARVRGRRRQPAGNPGRRRHRRQPPRHHRAQGGGERSEGERGAVPDADRAGAGRDRHRP